jgi:hypothetical protein
MTFFATNPKPIRAPDGTFLVYHVGCGDGQSDPIVNCSRGVTPAAADAGAARQLRGAATDPQCGGGSTSILASNTPYGPWQNLTVIGPPGGVPFPSSMDNPSPMFYPNGSVAVMFRSYTTTYPAYHSVIGIARADTWQGPYTNPTAPIFMPFEEDPFMWVSAKGREGGHMHMHVLATCCSVSPIASAMPAR